MRSRTLHFFAVLQQEDVDHTLEGDHLTAFVAAISCARSSISASEVLPPGGFGE
jgi:hypothetical protein